MSNSVKGRNYVLSMSVDAGTTWLPMAGFKAKELTRENPIADETNQATTGNETEAGYTGYSTVTISGSGTSDTRTSTLAALNDFIALANAAAPEALLKFENAALGIYEGIFLISNFTIGGDQNALVEFSCAFQNAGVVTFTAGT